MAASSIKGLAYLLVFISYVRWILKGGTWSEYMMMEAISLWNSWYFEHTNIKQTISSFIALIISVFNNLSAFLLNLNIFNQQNTIIREIFIQALEKSKRSMPNLMQKCILGILIYRWNNILRRILTLNICLNS